MIHTATRSSTQSDAPSSVLSPHLGQYGSWLDSLSDLRADHDEPPSIRATKNIERGRRLLREGDTEAALLAFQAALLNVLQSEAPEDLAVRRLASNELLQIMRGEA